jgi:hypothetical protein
MSFIFRLDDYLLHQGMTYALDVFERDDLSEAASRESDEPHLVQIQISNRLLSQEDDIGVPSRLRRILHDMVLIISEELQRSFPPARSADASLRFQNKASAVL